MEQAEPAEEMHANSIACLRNLCNLWISTDHGRGGFFFGRKPR